MSMTRAEVRERAKSDPAYAAVLGLCGLDVLDDEALALAVGRGLMAISAMESNGWMLVRAPCSVWGGHGVEEVYGGHGTVLEAPCSVCTPEKK